MNTNVVMLGPNFSWLSRFVLKPTLTYLKFFRGPNPPLNYQYYRAVLYYRTKYRLGVSCEVR